MPYFNDISKMHWFAQPFALVCNVMLSMLFMVGIAVLYALYVAFCVLVFAITLPLMAVSEVYDWFTR